MTEEEYRRLQAKFGGDKPTPAVSNEAMADETFEALAAKFEGRAPAPAAPQPAPQAPEPESPSFGAQALNALKGLPAQAFGAIDTPYYVRQGAEAAARYLPQSMRDSAGTFLNAVNPARPAMEAMDAMGLSLPDYATGEAPVSDLPGLRQARELLASENPDIKPGTPGAAARTFVDWAGPGMFVKSIRNIAQEGIERLPRALDNTRQDVLMGAGAAGGEAGVGYLSPEYAWIGELAGGLGGLAAGLRTGKYDGLSKDQINVMKVLNEMYDNPDEALAQLKRRVDAGEIGTIGDLTREDGVFDLENWSAKATPEGRRMAKATGRDRINQIYDDVTAPMRTGADPGQAPFRAGQAIDSEFRAAEQATQRAARELEGEATEASDAARRATKAARRAAAAEVDTVAQVNPGRAPYRISRELSEEYSAQAKAFDKAEVRPAWRAFEEGGVDVATIRGDVSAYERGLRPKQQEDLQRHYGSLVGDLRELDSSATPADVQGIIADMKAAVNKGYGEASNVPARATRLLDDLTRRLEANLADANPAYEAAVAKTKELHKRFSPSDVGRARSTAEPEVLAQRLGLTGDQGAVTARLVKAARTRSLQPLVADYIRAQAVRTPNIGNDFLVQYEAALDILPAATRADIVRIVRAKEGTAAADTAATAAGKEADEVASRVEREQKGLQRALEQTEGGLKGDIRGRYAEAPNKTIDNLLGNPDGATELKELMDQITDLDEVASFKANVGDRLEQQLFQTVRNPDTGVTNSVNTRAQAYENYIKMQDDLVEAGVLTADEARKVESAIERTNTESLRKASRAYDITQQADEHLNLLASGGAAAILGPMPGAYSLMVGGAIRRTLNSVLRQKYMAERMDVLADYLNNPKKYLSDLDRLDTADAIEKALLTRLVGATQAAEIIGGDEQ